MLIISKLRYIEPLHPGLVLGRDVVDVKRVELERVEALQGRGAVHRAKLDRTELPEVANLLALDLEQRALLLVEVLGAANWP